MPLAPVDSSVDLRNHSTRTVPVVIDRQAVSYNAYLTFTIILILQITVRATNQDLYDSNPSIAFYAVSLYVIF